MSPVAPDSLYCSEECESDDQVGARGEPLAAPGSDYSPVPPLVPAGGSSSCSSTPSSTTTSPHHLPLIGGREEPTSLALPPSMASKTHLHFNYRYSIGEPKEGASPPFAPSSADGRSSSKSSSATPEAPQSIARTLTEFSGPPPPAIASTAPSLTLGRRSSLVSPRLRPVGASPHASPALRPLTAMSNLSLQRSRLESPPSLAKSAGPSIPMARRASVPLETTFESENEADDEALDASAFAHFLFEKSRRASDYLDGQQRRRSGIAAPATSPASRSTSMDREEGSSTEIRPTRYLFGRATPSPAPVAPVEEAPSSFAMQSRGRSQQRQEGSTAHRSVSPKLRARSKSNGREVSQDLFERGRRARRRVS